MFGWVVVADVVIVVVVELDERREWESRWDCQWSYRLEYGRHLDRWGWDFDGISCGLRRRYKYWSRWREGG